MEIKDESSAMLSNYEVYTLLTDIQAGQKGHRKPNKNQQNLATISYSTLKYLEKTPCKDQSPEIIEKFVQALDPYNLTKAEKLQLLNQRPTSAVEIQLLIEESEERLSEEQIEELLDLVVQFIPGDNPVGDGQDLSRQDAMDTEDQS